MLRRINLFNKSSRRYWVDPKSVSNSNITINYPLISKLEETQITINKIVNSPNPLTYSDRKELVDQVKALNEHIISIKKIAGTHFDLTKYT